MDKKLKTLKEIKEALAYEGKVSELKGDEKLLNFCFKNCVIVRLQPSDLNRNQKEKYTNFLIELTKDYLKNKPEIDSWEAFRQQNDTKKTHRFLHEFGVKGEVFPFREIEGEEKPVARPKTSLTLLEFYEMCQIQFHYSGSFDTFRKMITRQYGSFAEYCILKGYDINSTRWESEETALRVAAKLGSLEAVKTRSRSLLKYLEERNLMEEVFVKKSSTSKIHRSDAQSTKRFLTKSRFKVGHSCPTKLYYLDNPNYGNNRSNDTFLRALADGGFQVGELAKLYHPNGIEISDKAHDAAFTKTNELLSSKNATLFEAAIKFNDFFVRVDVLKKAGNEMEVIEVKAKSFDPSETDVSFFSKRGKKRSIRSEWESYLIDLAFQTFVVQKAFPTFKVSSFLMLADKSKTATVDGLNQRFFISRSGGGRSHIVVKEGTNTETIGEPVLCKINVDEAVNFLINEQTYEDRTFEEYALSLAKLVTTETRQASKISSDCKNCEYRIDLAKQPKQIKSGFLECLSEVTKLNAGEPDQPMVFDIWNFRKSQSLIESGRYFMNQVTEDDIAVKESDQSGLSSSQRQLLQVQKVKDRDLTPYIDIAGLKDEIQSWHYPLHFIDFETTTTALPFNKGRRPYEQIAFQFSHHVVHKDGKIEHKTQYIHRRRGEFPNFHFVRSLKAALENDSGTILRYSHHENSVLCQIVRQLEVSDVKDASDLVAWIKSITTARTIENIGWQGTRSMVDLCELVKRHYYSPLTSGSNSIKKVLPAILRESAYLADRYSKPIYGITGGIKSLNFKDWTWLQRDSNGVTKDPYKLLPPIFTEAELEAIEPIVNAGEIADGGTAMMAFAMMQFTEMSDSEATKIQDALLKYCELDTFAMVMIYEHWSDLVGITKKTKAA